METPSRTAWIDSFVFHANQMDKRAAPGALIKVGEQLWYSFHDEPTADIASLWVKRSLPSMLVRDAWVAACSHRLGLFDRLMTNAEADEAAGRMYAVDRLRVMDPFGAADRWSAEQGVGVR